MADTYSLINNATLTSTQTDVDFTNISQLYTDLVLLINSYTSSNGTIQLRFNGDTGANYYYGYMAGASSTDDNTVANNQTKIQLNTNTTAINNVWVANIINIFSYTATDRFKQLLAMKSMPAERGSIVGTWANSASAINSIKILGTFEAGSIFTLYGIKAA